MSWIDYIKEPWPWYISGPLIGLMVPLLLLFDNRQFGVSSTLRDFCAWVSPRPVAYFRYNLKEKIWRSMFVSGIILGGSLSALFLYPGDDLVLSEKTMIALTNLGLSDFSGFVPEEIFSGKGFFSFRGFVFILVGGFLIGFGTRYADGCTSGHAIMGLSLISVLGFFAGGLISTHVLFPLLL